MTTLPWRAAPFSPSSTWAVGGLLHGAGPISAASGRISVPLIWDELAIMTYLLSSTIYVFLPLIPDLAMVRDRTTGWRHVLYKFTSLGWRGREYEWHYLHKAIKIFAFAIIPIMFSVHTIVYWDFAMSTHAGWHSTIYGPYFIGSHLLGHVRSDHGLARGTARHEAGLLPARRAFQRSGDTGFGLFLCVDILLL
jgi:hypothetical protein